MSEHCCHKEHTDTGAPPPTCHTPKQRIDWLLWLSAVVVLLAYSYDLLAIDLFSGNHAVHAFTSGVHEMVHSMWWGVALGIVFIGILSFVPREFVMALLGDSRGWSGLFRATAAGVLLDLCSHGILMVGTKLYERGASTGQVIAFLLASPWNSLSLTLILFALIGVVWTVIFIVCSMAIALLVGWMFEQLTARGILPDNPNRIELPADFKFWSAARSQWQQIEWSFSSLWRVLSTGLSSSTMVLRWLLFGIVLAAATRSMISADTFAAWFGPTLFGLLATMLAATVIEVCSEGSVPVAADLFTRAQSPGNSFAFLMTGVATDYTEVMVLRDTTRSWRIALMLPVLSVPQVAVVAIIMNTFA